jgi:hypothetical protein
LLAIRSARDLETPRGKLPILPGAPHPLFLPTSRSHYRNAKGAGAFQPATALGGMRLHKKIGRSELICS